MTASGTAVPATLADGVFGPARELDGIDDSLDGGDPIDGSLDFGTGSFGYSLWVHQSQLLGSFDMPFYKGGPSDQEPGYCWLLGSVGWTAKITDTDGSFSDVELGLATNFQDRWVHLAAIVDRQAGTFSAYADGTLGGGQSLATRGIDNLSTTEPAQISRGDQQRFTGRVDEVRIYKTAVTAEWIATEFKNGNDPTFLTFGPEEEEP
jgi:hypothetical protein